MKVSFCTFIASGFYASILFVVGCKGKPSEEPALLENVPIVNQDQNSEKSDGNTYRMIIKSNPDIIEAGKQVVFSLTPQNANKPTEPVPLDNSHSYEIHLTLVSNDLSWFDQRHPGLADLGSYEQAYTFKKGGVYTLFADYKPMGSKDTVQFKNIGVNGSSLKSVTYTEPKLTSTTGPFQVTLSPYEDDHFESLKWQSIKATITKDSSVIASNTLGDYLGGKGHMVLIGIKNKDFQHVYSSPDKADLVFQVFFANPGLYRAWLQFQVENIIQTADFVIQVEQQNN